MLGMEKWVLCLHWQGECNFLHRNDNHITESSTSFMYCCCAEHSAVRSECTGRPAADSSRAHEQVSPVSHILPDYNGRKLRRAAQIVLLMICTEHTAQQRQHGARLQTSSKTLLIS